MSSLLLILSAALLAVPAVAGVKMLKNKVKSSNTTEAATERRVQVILEFSDDCGVTWDGAWEANTSIVQDESLPLPYAYLTLTGPIQDYNWNAHVIVGCTEAFDTLVAVEFPERRWRASTRYAP